MLQLNNQSRFAPLVQVLPDRDAVDTLYVVVRGTFTLAPAPELARDASRRRTRPTSTGASPGRRA